MLNDNKSPGEISIVDLDIYLTDSLTVKRSAVSTIIVAAVIDDDLLTYKMCPVVGLDACIRSMFDDFCALGGLVIIRSKYHGFTQGEPLFEDARDRGLLCARAVPEADRFRTFWAAIDRDELDREIDQRAVL